MIEVINGQLEINHDAGIIYFHTSDLKIVQKYDNVTILRLSNCPKPIPENTQIDLRFKNDRPITMERCQELAGSAWAYPTTRNKIVDPELGKVFASILFDQINIRNV